MHHGRRAKPLMGVLSPGLMTCEDNQTMTDPGMSVLISVDIEHWHDHPVQLIHHGGHGSVFTIFGKHLPIERKESRYVLVNKEKQKRACCFVFDCLNGTVCSLLKYYSSVRKKMAAVHLTTIPCEPNTANMAHRKLCFCEIHPRTNNIVHAGFQGFTAFLCAFMSVFAVFAR